MIDEIYDRNYQAARAQLNSGIDALARRMKSAILPGLSAQYRFEWTAPWHADPGVKH